MLRRPAFASLAALAAAAALTVGVTAGGAAAGATAGAAAAPLPLKEVARSQLSGPPVRFDYESVDPSTGLLWIAHMNASKLLAVSLKTRKIVHTVDAPGVHGVIAVPALGRVFASATNDRAALTLDARSGKVLASAPAGSYPDGLAWDPVERHVFVSDESGGVETVLDAAGRRIATIDLGGEAGNVQYDSVGRVILVAVQSRNDIAVIDPKTNTLTRRIPLARCDSDHGLLVDAGRRLALVACDGNATLLTLDLRSGKVTGTAPVGDSPDVLAFDRGLRRLYVAAESGTVAVFQERSRALQALGKAFLAEGAHSVAVDQATHLVYFPLAVGSRGGPQLLVLAPTGTEPGTGAATR